MRPRPTEAHTGLLHRLLVGWENEVVEFKEGAQQFSAGKTGEYVSALSNEASLRGLTSGWLVFGVSNSRQVVGTARLRKAELVGERAPRTGFG
ncbi:MAG: ATP-binding protein [Propionibacteriaceae bacterium]|nr:ATP-binding protein [Propionibacteriaceae bacterium]